MCHVMSEDIITCQNNKLIGTKQTVPRKQSKVSALFGALYFCFKLHKMKHQLYAALLRMFVLPPTSNSIGASCLI